MRLNSLVLQSTLKIHFFRLLFFVLYTLRGYRKSFFKGFDACGAPANHFLKVLTLAGLPQITF